MQRRGLLSVGAGQFAVVDRAEVPKTGLLSKLEIVENILCVSSHRESLLAQVSYKSHFVNWKLISSKWAVFSFDLTLLVIKMTE
jgi:hypothetical protein